MTGFPGPSPPLCVPGGIAATPSRQTRPTKRLQDLLAQHSGKCLDADGAGRADGANVIQWTCQPQSNQQWRLV
ncbi:RICIN domain-containing protein [Streptosporangium sp. NPDC049046]|uniref:RICIN domain-containing protein n=1 Tax=unclassified Streptosporangium TaxID=2632669 RepID=UPI0034217960